MKVYKRQEYFGSIVYEPSRGKYFHLGHRDSNRLDCAFKRSRASPVSSRDTTILNEIIGLELRPPIELVQISNSRATPDCLSAPFKCFLNITKRCNLYCRHCYNSSGEPDSPELGLAHVIRTLDELQRRGVFKVTLAGGEPLVHREIKQILGCLSETDLYVSIISNGIPITDSLASQLNDVANVRAITISLDGATAEDNDAVRGDGAFDRAIRGARILTRRFSRPVAGRVTLMQSNIGNVVKLPRLLRANGFSELKVNPCNPYGRAASEPSLMLSEEVYRDACEHLADQAAKHGIRMQIPSFKYQKDASSHVGLCRAGQETFEVDGDGGVYPCSFSFGRFMAGNVTDGDFDRIFANLQVHSINNDWCYACKGRGGKGEKTFGYVPQLVEIRP